MPSPDLEKAMHDILLAKVQQNACDAFRNFVSGFSIDTFSSGEIDLDNRKRVVFHCMEWPDDWRKFYLASGLVEHDPVLNALKTADAPFTWNDLRKKRRLSEAGSGALARIATAGWTDGLVVPLWRGGSRYGLVSLVARDHAITLAQKKRLSIISCLFHAHIKRLTMDQGFVVPPCGLTPREIECTKLVAQGNSDDSIAAAIGIAASTVHEHIERARRKMDSKTRAQLASLCISMGIFSI